MKKGAVSLDGIRVGGPNGVSLDETYYISPSLPTSPIPPMMNPLLEGKFQLTIVKDEDVLSISDIVDLRTPAGEAINALIRDNGIPGLDDEALSIEGGLPPE